jgi:ELWxxDGT repeat protein
VRLRLEPLEDRLLLSAFLVKDINTNTVGSQPTNLVNVNGTLFFSASDNSGKFGLWRSDGTAQNTAVVQEFSTNLENLVNVNGELFFVVSNGRIGGPAQLWKSDGTTGGTALVKDFTGQDFILQNGQNGSATVVAFQNELYFVAHEMAAPRADQLWKSDGTAAGTVPVDPGAFNAGGFGAGLTVMGNELFFPASDATHGNKLWKTDGTDAGTGIADADVAATGAEGLINANGTLYFFAVADPTFQTTNLYRSDGTDTTLVASGFSNFGIVETTFSGGHLFFTAAPTSSFFTEGLWVSDGTAGGTRELNPANVSPFGLNPFNLHAVNGRVVFNGSSAAHPTFDQGIWTSDGTDAGTFELPTPQAAFITLFPSETALSGNALFFGAAGTSGQQLLWQTDGTASGTQLITTIAPGFYNGTRPTSLTFVGSTLFFNAADPAHGNELWASDGTAAGTRLVKDLNTNTLGSFPFFLTNADGTLLFTANSGPLPGLLGNPEIWKSNGTTAGTQVVTIPAFPSPLSDAPGPLVSVHDKVFFTAEFDPQLWVTDGTATGTKLLKDFSEPNAFVALDNLTAVGNFLFFTVLDGATGTESLWKSDGTVAGTQLVQDNVLVVSGSGVAAGNTFFFVSPDPVTFAFQLWESNGTGAHVVDPNHPGTNVTGLTNVDGTLYYFDQGANFNDLTLWKTDGTTAVQVAAIHPGDFAFPYDMVAVHHTLYFAVSDSSTGTTELWESEGTADNTGPITAAQLDFTSGSAVALGGRLFFTATDPVKGEQLWVSDGAAANTHPVATITAGTDSFGQPLPFNLTAFHGRVFFTASDPIHGEELWASNGRADGTALVQDINPGSAGSDPSQLTVVGHTLFFAATDLAHGTELWAYRDSDEDAKQIAGTAGELAWQRLDVPTQSDDVRWAGITLVHEKASEPVNVPALHAVMAEWSRTHPAEGSVLESLQPAKAGTPTPRALRASAADIDWLLAWSGELP